MPAASSAWTAATLSPFLSPRNRAQACLQQAVHQGVRFPQSSCACPKQGFSNVCFWGRFSPLKSAKYSNELSLKWAMPPNAFHVRNQNQEV